MVVEAGMLPGVLGTQVSPGKEAFSPQSRQVVEAKV